MSRQEEFNDIPDLGPASDELDRDDIPTLKPISEVAAKPHSPSQKSASNSGLYVLFLLLVAGVATAGFFGFQQFQQLQAKLQTTEQNLLAAQGRLTDIESLVSATDDSVTKSGAALQAQLQRQINEGQGRIKKVDSEIAKLWAIYQKYKPRLETVEKQQGSQSKQLNAHKSELKTLGQSLDTIGLSIDEQTKQVGLAQKKFAKFGTQLQSLDTTLKADQKKNLTEFGKLSDQIKLQDLANQEIDDLQAVQLDEMQAALDGIKANPKIPSSLTKQLKEHQKALDSINSYRRQINSEVLKLRQRLGQLQLSVDAASVAKP